MSEFRGSFFRQQQTDFCASIAEPPQKGFDEHNPPGSMFRTEQTLHLYGTLRFRRVEPQTESEQTSAALLAPHPAPQVEEIPPLEEHVTSYQAREFLSFDLSHINSRRLLLMASERLLMRAAQIEDDGYTSKDLRPYSKNVVKAHARFDRTIKPKGPLGFLREKLFDD